MKTKHRYAISTVQSELGTRYFKSNDDIGTDRAYFAKKAPSVPITVNFWKSNDDIVTRYRFSVLFKQNFFLKKINFGLVYVL